VSKDIWEFLPGAFIGHVDEHENRNSRTPGKTKTALPPALTSASTSMEGTGWVIWTGVSVPKTNNVGSFVGQLRRSEGACVCGGGWTGRFRKLSSFSLGESVFPCLDAYPYWF